MACVRGTGPAIEAANAKPAKKEHTKTSRGKIWRTAEHPVYWSADRTMLTLGVHL